MANYLDKTGLAKLWSKIKETFALKNHNHDTAYVSKSLIDGGDSYNQTTQNNIPTKNSVATYTSNTYAAKSHKHASTDITGLANVATSGKYSDLSGTPTIPTTLPASDVYAWAKAATKPSYSWSEITSKPSWIGDSKPSYSASEVGAASSTHDHDDDYVAVGNVDDSSTWNQNTSSKIPTKNSVATYVNTFKTDGIAYAGGIINRLGTCSTGASTAAKTVSITTGTFNLESGAKVTVKFTNANTASTPTLNVNSKGAKNIYHKGTQITTGSNKSLLAGVVEFVYDGTQFHLIGNYIDSNTTYSAGTGIALSNNTFSNSGVRSITQDSSNGRKLTIDTGGTSTTITIPDSDTKYTLPNATSTTLGGVKIGSNISVSSGTISLSKTNVTDALGYTPPTTDTTYSAATSSAAGLMSATDKAKLDGIASNANNYSLPTAGSSLGGVKTTSTVTSTSGLTACPIISGVPYYKDTNTTYTHPDTHPASMISGLATVATSGKYSDLSGTPTIPSAVTEATVAGWGFTKNTGTSNFSGNYNDLTNKPTIPTVNNATLTIQKNGTTVKTFTANASTNVTANITVPTSASDVGAAPSSLVDTVSSLSANLDGFTNGYTQLVERVTALENSSSAKTTTTIYNTYTAVTTTPPAKAAIVTKSFTLSDIKAGDRLKVYINGGSSGTGASSQAGIIEFELFASGSGNAVVGSGSFFSNTGGQTQIISAQIQGTSLKISVYGVSDVSYAAYAHVYLYKVERIR